MRFRASRRVRKRGERGKFERTVMSLSVRSSASWGLEIETGGEGGNVS